MRHNGHEINLTRRRYGKTTSTWLHVLIDDHWQEAGDPVQKIMPSKKDLDEAIERAHAHRRAELQREN